MNGLDLFSGIGGITLALEPWVNTIAYCENDKFPQAVLLSRMLEGKLPKAPIWDDVSTLSKKELPVLPDIIFGGFPCQDISQAGRREGLGGKRSILFFEIIRLTKEIRPAFVFIENVPAIRTRGLSEIVNAFTELRYDCRWTCVSAREVGAPHLRKRWFLLAHARGSRLSFGRRPEFGESLAKSKAGLVFGAKRRGQIMADPESKRRREGRPEPKRLERRFSVTCGGKSFAPEWWEIEPFLDRVVDGLPHRVGAIKSLGNAVVPAQAREAFVRLLAL